MTARRDVNSTSLTTVVMVGGLGLSTVITASLGLTCPMRAVTGWDCPLCGGTRAVLAVGGGRWVEALRDNLLVALSPVVAVLAMVAWVVARWSGRALPRLSRPAVMVVGGLLVWTVLRNLPALVWLRPLDGG